MQRQPLFRLTKGTAVRFALRRLQHRRRVLPVTTILGLAGWLGLSSTSAQTPPPGTLDSTFNPTLGTYATVVHTVAAQADGKVLLGGDFTKVNGIPQKYLTRLNASGTVDSAFQNLTGGDSDVRAVVVQSDGRIVLGGDFWTMNGASWRGVARLNADGTPDFTFGQFSGINSGKVLAVAAQADGKILIGGDFTQVNGVSRNYLARLNVDGSLDSSFTATADYTVTALALRPDGRILVGGQFTHINNASHNYLVQLSSGGAVDSGFNVDLDYFVQAIALQTNGQAIIGGWFSKVNGVSQANVARLNTDGSRDGTFTANTSGTVYTLALDPTGKILIGGRFSTVNGSSRNNLARLNANGLLDPTFDTGVGPDLTVRSTALQSDGKVFIGGDFSNVSMQGRTFVARLFGDPPPPPPAPEGVAQIFSAVEVGWASVSNVQYQVQWSPETAPTQWQNFGSPITGNGGTNWVFDTTRGGPRKFYRVVKLQ